MAADLTAIRHAPLSARAGPRARAAPVAAVVSDAGMPTWMCRSSSIATNVSNISPRPGASASAPRGSPSGRRGAQCRDVRLRSCPAAGRDGDSRRVVDEQEALEMRVWTPTWVPKIVFAPHARKLGGFPLEATSRSAAPTRRPSSHPRVPATHGRGSTYVAGEEPDAHATTARRASRAAASDHRRIGPPPRRPIRDEAGTVPRRARRRASPCR